jgi:catechol 2,3-dioxygenase-like lactoylglutathione lyase family enzyme
VFDHVTIRVSELAASKRFYDLAFEALEFRGRPYVSEELPEWNDFSLMQADGEHPVTRRLHAGFVAPSRAHVDTFWSVLTAAGYRDDGPPGPRPEYRDDYYGSFVLDPDGNSAEAVRHGILRDDGGLIDHLWLRVRDVEAAKRFYETIASVCGFVLRKDDPDWVGFRGQGGSCSFVAGGQPTENVHLAFGVANNTAVDEFHRVALAAGYRDNGGPGERPVYHPGYYGAYVLDPDGNNIEAVCHNRDQA